MIFVDANVPMYLIGTEHPNKGRARDLIEALAASGERLVTDVEVYQELLHRYAAIRRLDAVPAAIEVLDGVVTEVLGFDRADVLDARDLLASTPGLSARDAIHLAVMRRAGVSRILSFDRAFDAFPDVERVG